MRVTKRIREAEGAVVVGDGDGGGCIPPLEELQWNSSTRSSRIVNATAATDSFRRTSEALVVVPFLLSSDGATTTTFNVGQCPNYSLRAERKWERALPTQSCCIRTPVTEQEEEKRENEEEVKVLSICSRKYFLENVFKTEMPQKIVDY